MKHIVVDLEMNNLAKRFHAERSICRMEVIEIGAVVLDEDYSEIGSFKALVKPQYSDVIHSTVARITGITTEMVANAPVFEDALNMFLSWCHSINDDVRFYQWSESDLSQLLSEIILKEIHLTPSDYALFEDWRDFQKEYENKLHLTRSVSLKNAIMYAGLEFEGQEHDALWDARNTATLLKILRDPKLCKEKLDRVIEVLTPTPLCASLGDLFNFNDLFEATV